MADESIQNKLIEGAGLAASVQGAPHKDYSGQYDAFMQIHEDFKEQYLKIRAAREKEKKAQVEQYTALANRAVDSEELWTEQEHADLVATLQAESDAFSNTSLTRNGKQQRAEMLNNLQKRSDNIDAAKNSELEVATLISNGELSTEFLTGGQQGQDVAMLIDPNGPGWYQDTESGEYVVDIYNPNLQKTREQNKIDLQTELNDLQNVTERTEVENIRLEQLPQEIEDLQTEINNAYEDPNIDRIPMNAKDLDLLVNKYTVDEESIAVFDNLETQLIEEAENTPVGREKPFDYNKYYDTILDDVIANGKKWSLINDPVIGGKSFKQELTNAIIDNLTYEEIFGVGINELVTSLDPNTDNDPSQVSPADAEIIVSKIIEDETMINEYLAHYFTSHYKAKYDNALANSRPIE